MKVLCFLEWFELHHGFNGVGTAIEGIQTVTMKMQTVSNFYSQTFKPELITELFEGWELKETNYKTFNLYLEIQKDVSYWWAIIRNNKSENCYEIRRIYLASERFFLKGIYPQTLDHFITDCQRAGIELTWKPEVINKYFK
jgi:hypothetical protein